MVIDMETLKDFKYTMESCNHCGQCKWILPPRMKGWDFAEICPIHQRYGFDAYSGQGFINIAKEILDGKLSYDKGLADMIYTCTCCGACDVNCKAVRDMEVLDTILALRADCVKSGALPNVHIDSAKLIEETHNLFGKPHADRCSWLPEDFTGDEDADTVCFIGCAASYRYPETALNTIKILRAGGVRFKLLKEDEWCCGSLLWRTGQTEAAAALVERNIEVFRKHGVKTLITSCAECYGAFRSGYPRFIQTDFETRHISEVALELIKDGRLKLQASDRPDIKAVYHDPCMLGRLSEPYVPWEGEIRAYGLHVPPKKWRRGTYGVYEQPRAILNSIPGVKLIEMTRKYENAFCCGMGGGAADVNPEFASWAANERRREARSVGADAIVSCCPFCKSGLENEGENRMKCYDLTTLLAESLTGGI